MQTTTPPVILVADDNAGMRMLIARLVSRIAVVHECADGEQAVAMHGALLPDLVLMDIRMPLLDGIEATRRIRCTHPTAQVIVVTEVADAVTLQAAALAGAAEIVSKDNLLTLPRIIDQLLNRTSTLSKESTP